MLPSISLQQMFESNALRSIKTYQEFKSEIKTHQFCVGCNLPMNKTLVKQYTTDKKYFLLKKFTIFESNKQTPKK